MDEADSAAASDVERTFRESYGQAVATLVRIFGDITTAEDAVQDAFTVASERWRRDGIPPNPAGWIVTTARNKAIDTLRRENRGRELAGEIAASQRAPNMEQLPGTFEPHLDDQLRLIFTCCHPALRPEHRVALTLRLLGGLSVDEVARSFLVTESAMAKRLTRAKYKIRAANIPYRIPQAAELPARLDAVLTVLYLIYNTGAAAPDRSALRKEAIRLARELVALMPDEPEAAGLLALLLLNESRVAARWRGDAVVVLRDQDRSQWDRDLIAEGQAIVRTCIRRDRPGPFQLQAAIQAVHSAAPNVSETDWRQVVSNYDRLMAIAPTAVVALNRAIAVAELEGPQAALDIIVRLHGELADYHLFHATQGEMLNRLGRIREARSCFAAALNLAGNETDRRFLERRIAELDDPELGSAPNYSK